MQIKTVLLDMDEVLCDFVGGALDVHCWSKAELVAKHRKGKWNIVPALGLTEEEFWRPILLEGERFWSGLAPTPWMRTLINAIRQQGLNWYIVTTPSRDPHCIVGKQKWLREHLGDDGHSRLVTCSDKWLLARSDRVLVDDRDSSIHRFRAEGGWGVTFPNFNNSLHALAHDPLAHVLPFLKAFPLLSTPGNNHASSLPQRQ